MSCKAEAAFNGHVIAVERKTNQLTGSEFVWCLVRSTGGTFDVVADPEVLPGQPPVGGVISGSFWLTGRIGACEAAINQHPGQPIRGNGAGPWSTVMVIGRVSSLSAN